VAHLDSTAYDSQTASPGADDNASGVAVNLEIARLARYLYPDQTIGFAVVSNEERGQAGSKAYVKSRKDKDKIQAVIKLDVLRYSRFSNPLQVKALRAQRNFRGMARAIY
jgi:Zn-dependent M28 family amino/carboxypeptidase